MADLLFSLKNYLIAQGLVRDPADAAHPTLPPLWLSPLEGVPAPGAEDAPYMQPDLVVAAFNATGVPPRPFQGFIRTDGVEFILRTVDPKEAKDFESSIRTALNDKRNWFMDLLQVNESMLYRDLQPAGSTPNDYQFNFEYLFTLWN